MIEKILRQYLLDSPNIRTAVDDVWASYIPAGVPGAPAIIVRQVGEDPNYWMENELGTTEARVQIDCYHESPLRSEDLSKRVNNRLSGVKRTIVRWLDGVDLRSDTIFSAIRDNGSALPEVPRDASDRWKHRYMLTYRVFYTITAPTHL